MSRPLQKPSKLKPEDRFAPFRHVLRHPPEGVPQGAWNVLRYSMWRVCFVFILPMTLLGIEFLGAYGYWGGTENWPRFFRRGVPIAGGLFIGSEIIFSVMSRRRFRRFRERLDALEYEMCLDCARDLSTFPDASLCPECGCQYTKDDVRESWQEWFSS